LSNQQETSNQVLICETCRGSLVVDEDYCRTSYPCQHDAHCPTCNKMYVVYGSNIKGNPSCGPYHLDFGVAMNAR
jgi:uncharacterized CHY-type Zn-finger protein